MFTIDNNNYNNNYNCNHFRLRWNCFVTWIFWPRVENCKDASCKSAKQNSHKIHLYKCIMLNIPEESSIRCNLLINVHSSSVIKLKVTTMMAKMMKKKKKRKKKELNKKLKWFEIGCRRSGLWMKLMRHTMRHLCDQILLANPTISKMAKVIIIQTTTK